MKDHVTKNPAELQAVFTRWNNKYLRTDTKTRIYAAVIRPVLMYITKTRSETAKI